MRHKFLVLSVKKWSKSAYIYGSYRKIKTGVLIFGPLGVVCKVLLLYCCIVKILTKEKSQIYETEIYCSKILWRWMDPKIWKCNFYIYIFIHQQY